MSDRARGGATSASQLDDDFAICRYLGDDGNAARDGFEAARALLRPELAGRPAITPRIWDT
jgi:urease accessory protein UreH